MEALGFGIRGTINDVLTLEWNKYVIKDINKYIQGKIKVAIDREDTWRMWDPHKLEFLCHMASSSCHFESIRIPRVLG